MLGDVLELREAAELLVEGVDDHQGGEARQREQHPSEEGKYVVEKYEVVDNCAITEMEKFPYDDNRHGDQV